MYGEGRGSRRIAQADSATGISAIIECPATLEEASAQALPAYPLLQIYVTHLLSSRLVYVYRRASEARIINLSSTGSAFFTRSCTGQT